MVASLVDRTYAMEHAEVLGDSNSH